MTLPAASSDLRRPTVGVRLAWVLSASTGLHRHPRGQQILLAFKMGMLLPVKPAHLETVRELTARQHKLRNLAEKKAPMAAVAGGRKP